MKMLNMLFVAFQFIVVLRSSTPVKEIPTLPESFSVVVEANILNKQYSFTMEEHYDYNMNAISFVYRSAEKHELNIDFADYNESIKVSYNPKDTSNRGFFYHTDARNCSISSITGRMAVNKKTGHVRTTPEMLGLGDKADELYMGEEVIRGIQCDRWDRRITHPGFNNSTESYIVSWYFSSDGFNVGGENMVPVRAVVNGTSRSNNSDSENLRQFYHIYEYVGFHTSAGPLWHSMREGRWTSQRAKTFLEGCHAGDFCSTRPDNDDICVLLEGDYTADIDGAGDENGALAVIAICIGFAVGIFVTVMLTVFVIKPLTKSQNSSKYFSRSREFEATRLTENAST